MKTFWSTVALALVFIFLFCCVVYTVYSILPKPHPQQIVVGDVNGDGRVNAVDLTMMRRHIIGMYNLTPRQIRIGDVNHNGRIDELDLEIFVDIILERSPTK